MISANEARERTLKVFTARNTDMFTHIEEAIDVEIEKANDCVTLYSHQAPPKALAVLKKLGYTIVDNGAMAMVSWSLTD
jgi:hypothetical protein